MKFLYLISFVFFLEKEIFNKDFLNMISDIKTLERSIDYYSFYLIIIIIYLFINYIRNFKNLIKFIFYFFIIFLLFIYKNSTNFYGIISLLINNLKFLIFIFLLIFLLILSKIFFLKEKNKIKFEKIIYPSRKNKLQTLSQFLNIYNQFSITGKWGIGKSFFVKYFFDSFDKKNYESILIDVGAYLNNENILKKIDSEINSIFKKYKIFRFSPSIFKDININNSFMDILKNLLSHLINDNFDSCINLLPCTIVLCLDNLERINNFNRITTLFSALDEQLISKITNKEKIKIIYIYDKDYMEKIFKKEIIDFNLYITKYSDSSIQIYEIDDNDFNNNQDYEKIKKIRNNMTNRIHKRYERFDNDLNLQIDMLLNNKCGITYDNNKDSKRNDDFQKLLEKYDPRQKEMKKIIQKKIELIKSKLQNPRFILQCLNFKNNDLPIDIFIKYKLILDIFQNVDLTKENIGKINIIKSLETIQKQDEIYLSIEKQELIMISFILFEYNTNEFENFIDILKTKGLI